jgi:hypothetical protein
MDPAALARGAKAAGLDGVVVTEHSPCAYGEIAEALRGAGIMFVPAREVACGGAHVLVLSADEALLKSLPRAVDPKDERLSRSSVACVWAHPAALGGSSAYPPNAPDLAALDGVVAAVELLNGRHLHDHRAVSIAREIGEDLGLPMTGGSDAHREEDVGRCATRFDDRLERPEDVIAALRLGEGFPVLNSLWAAQHGYDYRMSLMEFLG